MGNGRPGSGGFAISVEDAAGPVSDYVAGRSYTLRITNVTPYKGFLLQSVAGNPGAPGVNGVGSIAWVDDALYQHGPCVNPAPTVTHRRARAEPPRTEDVFTWTAPPMGTGPVTFHLVGVVSRFIWYGGLQTITVTLPETIVAVQPRTWATVRLLYR